MSNLRWGWVITYLAFFSPGPGVRGPFGAPKDASTDRRTAFHAPRRWRGDFCSGRDQHLETSETRQPQGTGPFRGRGLLWRAVCSVFVSLFLILSFAVPSWADTYNIDTDGTYTITGTAGDDNFNINNPEGVVFGSLDGAGGSDTLNISGRGELRATIQNFEVLNKTGAGQYFTLDTNVDLTGSGGGDVTIINSALGVATGRTLTTNTLNMTGDGQLGFYGTVTVGGGTGTIIGDGGAQIVGIRGPLNGNVNLGGGDDAVWLYSEGTIANTNTLDGGAGTDTLELIYDGTLSAIVSNFETLTITGSWTLDTNVDLTGLGGGDVTIVSGTLTVAAGRTLTTGTLSITHWGGLTINGTVTVGGGAGTITGDDTYQTVTISGTLNGNANLGDDDDTVNLQTGATIANTNTLDGGAGTDTLNLDGSGTLVATILNFEVLNKTGVGAWTLNTNVDLTGLGGGTLTISGGNLVVAPGRTLTTGALSLTGAVGLTINGTVTVGSGMGAITCDNDVQVVTISGTLNGNANLGGGDDTVNLQTGATIANTNTLDGGAGTDTLTLDGIGTLTATIQNFEVLNKTGAGTWTLNTDVNLGAAGAVTVIAGTLAVAATRTLTTNTALIQNGATLIVSAGSTFTFTTATIENGGTLAWTNAVVVNGSTVAVDAGGAFNYTTLVLQSGGSVTIDGTATAATSTIVAGTTTINNGGTLNGQASMINNGGTLTINSGGNFNYATVAVDPGGTMNVAGTGTAATSTTVAGTVNVDSGGTLNGQASTVQNGGTLTVNTGGIFTATTLVVDNGGAFNLNLAGVAVTTTSVVVNGQATVNGALASPTVTVGATGNLGGTGLVTGNLTNNGTTAPGSSIGTLTVAGNYIQGAGGTLQVEINANGTNDLLHVTGTATLAGTLEIVTLGTYTGSNQHVVLQADGGIIGTFDTFNASNTLRHRFAVQYSATQVIVQATVLTYESLVQGYGNTVINLAKNLDLIANSATGDMATIINQLDNLPNAASLAAAFSQLHCGLYHALNTVNFNTQHLFIAQGQARLFQLRTGIPVTTAASGLYNPATGPLLAYSGNLGQLGRLLANVDTPAAVKDRTTIAGRPGDALGTVYAGRRFGLWVRPFGIIEDQDPTADLTGYNFTTTGFSAGFDYRITKHFIAGIALGYAVSRVKYDDVSGSDGQVETYIAGIYGTWFGPRWFMEFSLSYGRNSFDMNRRIKFGGVNRTATANYRGGAVAAQLGGGYDFPLGRRWTVGPIASLEAVYQEQDGFAESGAGALNLKVGRQTATSVRSAFGVRVKRIFRGSQGRRVTISLSALWVHEFANDAQSMNASLQGNPAALFSVTTPEPERDALRLGIGITARINRRVALFVAYQPEFRKDNQSHYLSGGVRIEF